MSREQPSGRGRNCFACGGDNERGLHMVFRREGDRTVCDYIPLEYQQGYPGRMHGGVVATLIDDAMGWAIYHAGAWGATARLSIRYRKPVPLDENLRIKAWVVGNRSRLIEARAELRDSRGTLLAEAESSFMKLDEPLASAMNALAAPTEQANAGESVT